MRLRPVFPAILVVLALAGCGAARADVGAASDPAQGGAAGTIAVVASTDVWGSVVQSVGGSQVSVTSILDDPNKNPHEYEASASNQLALSKAALVVENGGGFDDFVDTMLTSTGSGATVINAVDVSGHDQHPAEGELNEHVWYDLPTVAKVADAVASELGALDAGQAATFQANATAFKASLSALQAQEAAIKQAHAGEGAAITEPLPVYLLTACGLVNKTPDAFSEAIEEDSDVAPAVLKETMALFSDKAVEVLAYDQQNAGPQTETVLAAAKENDIPVVPVTETLPKGQDYLTWMGGNVTALSDALGS